MYGYFLASVARRWCWRWKTQFRTKLILSATLNVWKDCEHWARTHNRTHWIKLFSGSQKTEAIRKNSADSVGIIRQWMLYVLHHTDKWQNIISLEIVCASYGIELEWARMNCVYVRHSHLFNTTRHFLHQFCCCLLYPPLSLSLTLLFLFISDLCRCLILNRSADFVSSQNADENVW